MRLRSFALPLLALSLSLSMQAGAASAGEKVVQDAARYLADFLEKYDYSAAGSEKPDVLVLDFIFQNSDQEQITLHLNAETQILALTTGWTLTNGDTCAERGLNQFIGDPAAQYRRKRNAKGYYCRLNPEATPARIQQDNSYEISGGRIRQGDSYVTSDCRANVQSSLWGSLDC